MLRTSASRSSSLMPSEASPESRRRYALAKPRTAGARSGATRSSISSSSLPAGDPASVSSARLTTPASLCQPGLQRLELGAHLARQAVAELGEVLADLLELLTQAVLVDREQLVELVRGEVEALGVEVLG